MTFARQTVGKLEWRRRRSQEFTLAPSSRREAQSSKEMLMQEGTSR